MIDELILCGFLQKSGIMYKKLTAHSTFTKGIFVLTRDGHLLIYRCYNRTEVSGAITLTIAHDLDFDINLSNCYVYSGRPTIEDLTYTSQSIEKENFAPGGYRHIPRMYADGLITNDDDESCSFSIFKSRRHENHSQMTKKCKGTIYVFRARNRQEKEEWVLALNIVVERLVREETAEAQLEAWKKRREPGS